MKPAKAWFSLTFSVLTLAAGAVIFGHDSAQGELRWPEAKQERMRVRLVALAWIHPRSSFFANEEIFVAEKELAPGELRLIKLVYNFLPYQPRLSESGLDYSAVHELRAVRDPACDEMLSRLTSPDILGGANELGTEFTLRYSTDSPMLDLERRRIPLPCYVTTPEHYSRSVREPVDNRGRFQLSAR